MPLCILEHFNFCRAWHTRLAIIHLNLASLIHCLTTGHCQLRLCHVVPSESVREGTYSRHDDTVTVSMHVHRTNNAQTRPQRTHAKHAAHPANALDTVQREQPRPQSPTLTTSMRKRANRPTDRSTAKHARHQKRRQRFNTNKWAQNERLAVHRAHRELLSPGHRQTHRGTKRTHRTRGSTRDQRTQRTKLTRSNQMNRDAPGRHPRSGTKRTHRAPNARTRQTARRGSGHTQSSNGHTQNSKGRRERNAQPA